MTQTSSDDNYSEADDSGSDFEPEEIEEASRKPKKVSSALPLKRANSTPVPTAGAKKVRKANSAVEPSSSASPTPENDIPPILTPDTPSSQSQARTVDEIYQKKTPLEHILLRPDTYIGSVEKESQSLWVYDREKDAIVRKTVEIVPGLYKIFDEILVNAADNKQRDPSMSMVKVSISPSTNTISIYNNGRGIPTAMHQKEQVPVPELIFGHLLTSSNYDDTDKKIVGGRNGYGAKLCNIFSHEFIVETSFAEEGKKYWQKFEKNMSVIGTPKFTKAAKKDFTRITFKSDLAKFGMAELEADVVSLMEKRVYDMAGILPGVRVYLNDEAIMIPDFKRYVDMYLGGGHLLKGGSSRSGKRKAPREKKEDAEDEETSQSLDPFNDEPNTAMEVDVKPADSTPVLDESTQESNTETTMPSEEAQATTTPSMNKPKVFYYRVNPRWEIAFVTSDDQFQQVSFVNSIATTKGGTHVNYISDQIVDKIMETIEKKTSKLGKGHIKKFQIKNYMWLFINCAIDNPTFDSQTKENLTLGVSKFGSRCVIPDDFMNKILKQSGIVDIVEAHARFRSEMALAKTDGKKRSRISGIPKLDDANNAGTRLASDCTLILTEGESAKALAVCGLSVVGRDYFGVFPLRGKLLNVRDASTKAIHENAEITQLKQIIGLQHGKVYENTDGLRYGHIMIMADQDHDGSHIKGLVINLLDHFWPSLLRIPGFLLEFITPIVRVTKGRTKTDFFTIPEYDVWKRANDEGKGWIVKYYKGLGTSTPADAKAYFSLLSLHRKTFAPCKDADRELIDLAFGKKRANDRKTWLGQFQLGTFMSHDTNHIELADFINKELILFSMADNVRSIPSVMDGHKPGQRKIIYSVFKRRSRDEIKVAQLVGYVSQHTAYHHGEQSLFSTIVGLAQNYVGSNNINLLLPNGQFGTRYKGGKDAASARYIFTQMAPIARRIFHKDDDALLTYLNDDGQPIEPVWYSPVIPMVLVNGTEGIGTGWSTKLRPYNPTDIIANLRRKLKGEYFQRMVPWYRGFQGNIEAVGEGKYKITGIIVKKDDTTVEITELPVGTWTQTYKEFLEELMSSEKGGSFIKDYKEYHTDTRVHFLVNLTLDNMRKAEAEGLENKFKLIVYVDTSHMVCFDTNSKIRAYANELEIMEEFYHMRLKFYDRRKAHLLKQLQHNCEQLENRVRFITEVNDDKMKLRNRRKADIIKDLAKKGYRQFLPKDKKEINVADPDHESEENTEGDEAEGYNYLLNMSIYHMTFEKVEHLKADLANKRKEIVELSDKTISQLWLQDLSDLEEEWQRNCEEHEVLMKSATPIQQKTKRQRKKPVVNLAGDVADKSLSKSASAPLEGMEQEADHKANTKAPRKSKSTIPSDNKPPEEDIDVKTPTKDMVYELVVKEEGDGEAGPVLVKGYAKLSEVSLNEDDEIDGNVDMDGATKASTSEVQKVEEGIGVGNGLKPKRKATQNTSSIKAQDPSQLSDMDIDEDNQATPKAEYIPKKPRGRPKTSKTTS